MLIRFTSWTLRRSTLKTIGCGDQWRFRCEDFEQKVRMVKSPDRIFRGSWQWVAGYNAGMADLGHTVWPNTVVIRLMLKLDDARWTEMNGAFSRTHSNGRARCRRRVRVTYNKSLDASGGSDSRN